MNREEKKEKSKSKILDAAVKLFASEGYANCSTTKIAKNAKVSYGLLYYHFKNKNEILESVLENGLTKVREGYENFELTDDVRNDLSRFLDGYVESFRDERDFWFVYSGITLDPKISINSLKNLENEYSKIQNKYLIKLFERLGLEHPIAEAFFLDSCLYGLVIHACTMKEDTGLAYGVNMLKRKYGVG